MLLNIVINNTNFFIHLHNSVPFYHAMGILCALTYTIIYGSGLIYRTQQLHDIGFIPEMILDDMAETKALNTIQFPFHVSIYSIINLFLFFKFH